MVAAGVAGAVILPVAGVAVGATQIVRGVANQAEASRESKAGKVWDEVSNVFAPSCTSVMCELSGLVTASVLSVFPFC